MYTFHANVLLYHVLKAWDLQYLFKDVNEFALYHRLGMRSKCTCVVSLQYLSCITSEVMVKIA